MKGFFVFIFTLGFQTIVAQDNNIQTLTHKAMVNYLKTYFSDNELKQYFTIADSLSTVSLKIPLHQIQTNAITPKSISKIEYEVSVNVHDYHDMISLELNNQFIVKEKMGYNNNQNLTAQRMNSLKQFITYHNNNQILSRDTVYQFICKTYPNQQWNKPTISRGSFPPYSFYYETLETNCSKCKQVRSQLNELKEIGGNDVQMIPLK
jgi:hypothetical protein